MTHMGGTFSTQNVAKKVHNSECGKGRYLSRAHTKYLGTYSCGSPGAFKYRHYICVCIVLLISIRQNYLSTCRKLFLRLTIFYRKGLTEPIATCHQANRTFSKLSLWW